MADEEEEYKYQGKNGPRKSKPQPRTYAERKRRREARAKRIDALIGSEGVTRTSLRAKKKTGRKAHPNQASGFKNLKPSEKGETNNKRGINGSNYRDNAEATFAHLLQRIETRNPETGMTQTTAEIIVENLLEMAKDKDKWALDQVLERILPVTKHTDINVSAAPAAQFTAPSQYKDPNEWEEAAKKRDDEIIDVEATKKIVATNGSGKTIQ